MLNEINIKLKKLKNDVSLKSTLNCDIEMLDNNLNKEEKELRYLERQLNKEKNKWMIWTSYLFLIYLHLYLKIKKVKRKSRKRISWCKGKVWKTIINSKFIKRKNKN